MVLQPGASSSSSSSQVSFNYFKRARARSIDRCSGSVAADIRGAALPSISCSSQSANSRGRRGRSAGRPAEAQIDAGGGDTAEPQLLLLLFLSSPQRGEEPRGAGRRAAGFYFEKLARAAEENMLLLLGVVMATAGSGVSAARVVSGELLTDLHPLHHLHQTPGCCCPLQARTGPEPLSGGDPSRFWFISRDHGSVQPVQILQNRAALPVLTESQQPAGSVQSEPVLDKNRSRRTICRLSRS